MNQYFPGTSWGSPAGMHVLPSADSLRAPPLALRSDPRSRDTYLVNIRRRARLRKLNEGFRTPGLVVPVLGVFLSLAFLYGRTRWHFIAAAIAIVVGAVIYAVSKPRE